MFRKLSYPGMLLGLASLQFEAAFCQCDPLEVVEFVQEKESHCKDGYDKAAPIDDLLVFSVAANKLLQGTNAEILPGARRIICIRQCPSGLFTQLLYVPISSSVSSF